MARRNGDDSNFFEMTKLRVVSLVLLEEITNCLLAKVSFRTRKDMSFGSVN